jgi:hypothetical protein
MDNSYHGECSEAPGELCSMNARDGTMTCHRYCTAFVIAQGKPIALAVTPVRSDESREPAIDRVLTQVDGLSIGTEALLMHRTAYTGDVLGRLRQTARRSSPSGVSARASERRSPRTAPPGPSTPSAPEPSTNRRSAGGKPHLSERRLCQARSRVHGYVAYGHADRSPGQVADFYGKRARIEKSYKLFRTACATTITADPVVRLLFVALGFILETLWVVLRWAVIAEPRRGGRSLARCVRSMQCSSMASRPDSTRSWAGGPSIEPTGLAAGRPGPRVRVTVLRPGGASRSVGSGCARRRCPVRRGST